MIKKNDEELTGNYCSNIINVISDAVVITNNSGYILYKNESFDNLYDQKAENLIILFPNNEKYKQILSILNSGKTWDGVIDMVNTSGVMVKSSLKTFALTNSNDNSSHLLWICKDISENFKSEDFLTLLKHGIDNSEIAIYNVDDDGNINYANLYACKSLGYTYDELTSMKVFEIDPRITPSKFKKNREKAIQEHSNTIETYHKRKDGSIYPVEIIVNMIRFNDSGISMSFAKDITLQKEAESNFIKSRTYLNNTLQLAKLGNWEYDVIKDIFTFNDNFYSVYKTKVDQVGTYFLSSSEYAERFVFPDDKWIVNDEVQKAIQTSDPNYTNQIEHRICFPDGSIGFISVSFYIEKNEQGRTIKTYGINQDITERKRIENELVFSKEKAEESDRLKSAFLANMSHEIRTPMNGILGFADLLKKRNISDLQKTKYVDIIKRSGQRMLSIINDLIDISKIESGQVEVNINNTDVYQLLMSLYEFFLPEALRINLQLIFEKNKYYPEVKLYTDSIKLNQILSNLIKNSIKYTNNGYIRFGYEIIDKGMNNSLIQFFVRDSGIGINNQLKDKIFERFRQGELSISKNMEGAGLGLSITKAYVELLGGEIWLESEINKGSTFYFTLPLNI